ncbi:hypothetical protein [Roseomonas sp. WA12]
MKLVGVLVMALLIGAGAFLITEIFSTQRLAEPTERYVEAAPAARQAFEAGPMARNGLRIAELNTPRRVGPPQNAAPGLIFCRAEAVFSTGAQDTMWYGLIPAQGGSTGQFMIHAAPGEMGQRSIVALR